MLAAFQADEVDEWRDAQPGKILHELRQGEHGGRDHPLHPLLRLDRLDPAVAAAARHLLPLDRDLELCRRLLPNVERAFTGSPTTATWTATASSSTSAPARAGWPTRAVKDSHDSVAHVDGKLAEGPIALAEVQAYVYLAKLRLVEVFEALGDGPRAATLRAEADDLRRAFNEAFWVESEQLYAMALDGDKRQAAAISSNPAHGLYCGIVDLERAAPMARRLLAPDMFSGWGCGRCPSRPPPTTR